MAGPIPPLQTTRRRFTNEGIPLISEWLGGESDTIREIPPEWRAALDLVVTEQPVPTDRELFQLTDEILACKAEQKATADRTMRTIRKPAGVFTLTERFTNKDKEFGTRSRTFHFEDDFGSVPAPTATTDVNTKNFGNKHFEQVIESIPGVFNERVYSRERGIVTPEDFRAKLQTLEFAETTEGVAADPGPLSDGYISVVDSQKDVFLHRLDAKYLPLGDLPQFFINYETNQDKQVVQVTRWLLDDSTTPAVPTALRDTSFTNLGDGTALEINKDIDEVFPHNIFSRERPDITPEWARATLQTYEESFTEPGIADDPYPLADGVYLERQEQENVFDKRTTRRLRHLVDLPIQRVNKGTNQFKQVETITEILQVSSTIPDTPTALKDVELIRLGDGTAVEKHIEIAEVFDHKSVSIELPDLLPDIFKAAFPSYTHEFVAEGTSVDDPPILDTGDFFKSETRETEFTGKVVTRGRAGLSLPQTVDILRKTTEEYGGEIVKLTGFLDDSEPAVEEGLTVLSSEVRNLGNGTWFRQTEKLDTAIIWPALIGIEVDPRTGIAVEVTKQVVDAGTTGGVAMDGSYVDVKSIDKWRSLSISSKLTADSLPDPVTWETTVEHRFPNTLLGVAWIWQAAVAPFAYDFDMALVLDMMEGYAGPCRAKITESFSAGAPADVVTPTILCPQGHMVGYTWGYAADPSEDCGTCIGIARANAKTWTIPPSLHDTIDLTGTVTLAHGSFTSSLPATCPIGLPAAGTLITKACEVERWRFGVFYRKLTEIYVPDCSCL